MKRWYVARTQPGLGIIAERELQKSYGDRPAFQTLLIMDGKGRSVFGPYIFIEIDLDEDYWEPINSVRGVSRLLPIGTATPLPLPETFMRELRKRLGSGDFDERAAAELVYAYSPQEPALVTSGPWEGHVGNFVRRKKGFINLSLVLFNRPFEIPVPAHQVRPASPKAA
jgi:transcription antitermination factor NusG